MGRKSTKENKNAYQLRREALGLTREQAANLTGVSDDRIGRIELKDADPRPEEVLALAREYKDPTLCSYYCANQCKVGKKNYQTRECSESGVRDLPAIVLETIASVNAIDKHRERLIEIAADAKVDESEVDDFVDIQEALRKISVAVESLRLWAEAMKANGEFQVDEGLRISIS